MGIEPATSESHSRSCYHYAAEPHLPSMDRQHGTSYPSLLGLSDLMTPLTFKRKRICSSRPTIVTLLAAAGRKFSPSNPVNLVRLSRALRVHFEVHFCLCGQMYYKSKFLIFFCTCSIRIQSEIPSHLLCKLLILIFLSQVYSSLQLPDPQLFLTVEAAAHDKGTPKKELFDNVWTSGRPLFHVAWIPPPSKLRRVYIGVRANFFSKPSLPEKNF